MKKSKYLIVFVTVPDKKAADKITKSVLSKRLAACVNIISNINSFYWWQNKIENSKELLLIMKTVENKFIDLQKEIKLNHPYEVPEIIASEITDASKNYLKWINEYAG